MSRSSVQKLAHLTANTLPVYRSYRGFETARALRNEMSSPAARDWNFAARVLFDASTDKVDGMLARYAGNTWYGGYLDQMSDKIWFLAIARQLAKNGEIDNIHYSIPLVRDIGTTAIRPIAQHYGLNPDAKFGGKAKMISQVAATTAACSPLAADYPQLIRGLYSVSTTASIVSGGDMIYGYIEQIRDRQNEGVAAKFIAESLPIILDSLAA